VSELASDARRLATAFTYLGSRYLYRSYRPRVCLPPRRATGPDVADPTSRAAARPGPEPAGQGPGFAGQGRGHGIRRGKRRFSV